MLALPRQYDLVVDSVEFHMLQAPSLVDSFGCASLSKPGQIRRVIHANHNTVGSELGDERRKQ